MYFQFCRTFSLGRYSNENGKIRKGIRDNIDAFTYCFCFAYPGLIKNREAKQVYPKKEQIYFEQNAVSVRYYIGKVRVYKIAMNINAYWDNARFVSVWKLQNNHISIITICIVRLHWKPFNFYLSKSIFGPHLAHIHTHILIWPLFFPRNFQSHHHDTHVRGCLYVCVAFNSTVIRFSADD